MNRYRYSASARLSAWDSVRPEPQPFLRDLAKILRNCSHATIETEMDEFALVDDSAAVSILAIIDKMVARGNPTLVDLSFEKALLSASEFSRIDGAPIEDSPLVTWGFRGIRAEGSLQHLLAAAEDLIDLPYIPDSACPTPLTDELRAISSAEEDRFAEKFSEVFSTAILPRLHRQVKIQDLVQAGAESFLNERVDFALRLAGLTLVFEIDGVQHRDAAQRNRDISRDKLLSSQGWQVLRIPTHIVRDPMQLGYWFKGLVERIGEPQFRRLERLASSTVSDLIISSPLHLAAMRSILLPAAVHRCLRGLVQLFLYQLLPIRPSLRLLAIEEDLPVFVSAFNSLSNIWTHLGRLAPQAPRMPQISLDILGEDVSLDLLQCSNLQVRFVDRPDDSYDLILSHAFFSTEAFPGLVESTHLIGRPNHFVSLRSAIGLREERALQRSDGLTYDLADVERAMTVESNDGVARSDFATSEKYQALLFFLQLIFRKRDFRDGQLRAVIRLLQGKSTIVLLPTGGGKSLIFQLGGMLLPGMTVVIDPLVSLINDQVENLRIQAIDMVDFISSQLDPAEREAVLHRMSAGQLLFIFISPERLQTPAFRQSLKTVAARFPISLAVIDEAHCISEWGHDFRPAYLHLPYNLQSHCTAGGSPPPTLVGLTGTASFAVLADIQIEMRVRDEEAVIAPQSFDRKELRFDVRKVITFNKPDALRELKKDIPHMLRANPQTFYDLSGTQTNCGIIFCPHVNGSLGVEKVAESVGHSAYYSGEAPKLFSGDDGNWNSRKRKLQSAFKHNRIQELVATKSFGMGIDKENVRYTIHYTIPPSIEAFYQEAGRAGRNGKPGYGYCAILYSDDNWDLGLRILNESDHERALKEINSIDWDRRGDLLTQLWLLYNSYQGRRIEKIETVRIWKQYLAPAQMKIDPGGEILQQIPFYEAGGKKNSEKLLFRLLLLGVIRDYTIDWQKKRFDVVMRHLHPLGLKSYLRSYLIQYKFERFAEDLIEKIPETTFEESLTAATAILIDFIYDEIVARRKQAMRTMAEICRGFQSDLLFRESILSYLQESEFSHELKSWIGRPFAEIGVGGIQQVLLRVGSLEETRRLIGTARRMLDEDPQNVALRFLSACARAQNPAQSDAEVVQEVATLAIQIESMRITIGDAEEILLAVINHVAERRSAIREEVARSVFRHAGSASFARQFLQSNQTVSGNLKATALTFLQDNILQRLRQSEFLHGLNITQEHENGRSR